MVEHRRTSEKIQCGSVLILFMGATGLALYAAQPGAMYDYFVEGGIGEDVDEIRRATNFAEDAYHSHSAAVGNTASECALERGSRGVASVYSDSEDPDLRIVRLYAGHEEDIDPASIETCIRERMGGDTVSVEVFVP